MSRHDRFIAKTVAATQLSTCRFMVAAVVVQSGRTLSVAVNRWRCPTVTQDEIRTYHAEELALAVTTHTLGSTLYVARTGRSNGMATMARPCPSCWAVIVEAQVRQVVYTTWEGGYAIEQTKKLEF